MWSRTSGLGATGMPGNGFSAGRSRDALIAEVRRRAARRRLYRRGAFASVTALAAGVSVGVPLALDGGGRPATIKVIAPPPASSTEASTPETLAPACIASQLKIELGNIQGAAGNFVATFWVADGSPRSCLLESPARMDLLDAAGRVQLSAAQSFAPLVLSADTSLPLDNTITSGGPAYIELGWPTDPNAALAQGSANGSCPTPDFVPSTARFTFGSSGGVDVDQLRSGSFQVSICGKYISMGVGPVEATAIPPVFSHP